MYIKHLIWGSALQTPVSHEMPLPTSPDIVFECMWADCDVMFEDLADMHEHLINEQTGHVSKVTDVSSFISVLKCFFFPCILLLIQGFKKTCFFQEKNKNKPG